MLRYELSGRATKLQVFNKTLGGWNVSRGLRGAGASHSPRRRIREGGLSTTRHVFRS